jgi:hypothetical protein
MLGYLLFSLMTTVSIVLVSATLGPDTTQLIGGTSYDKGLAICTDSSNNVYFAGYTTSPTVNGKSNAGAEDMLVGKYSSSGTMQVIFHQSLFHF